VEGEIWGRQTAGKGFPGRKKKKIRRTDRKCSVKKEEKKKSLVGVWGRRDSVKVPIRTSLRGERPDCRETASKTTSPGGCDYQEKKGEEPEEGEEEKISKRRRRRRKLSLWVSRKRGCVLDPSQGDGKSFVDIRA